MDNNAQSLAQLYPKHIEIPILIVLSTGLLVYGLSLPIMHVEKMVFWNNEYSVFTGTVGLYHDKEYFLAGLLFFFSIVFPIVKLATLGFLWLFKLGTAQRNRILGWLGILGKWSMLDVFVVAILIVAVKLGPMANVQPGRGVYVFSLAIILSIGTTVWTEGLIKRSGLHSSSKMI
jgi:paraquat-inducible protein A